MANKINKRFKMNTKFIYQCTDCGKTYDVSEIRYLCPECASDQLPYMPPKGVLKVLYDYDAIKSEFSNFSQLKSRGFIDVLPIQSLSSFPRLRVGETPLYTYEKGTLFPFSVYLKDDSQNPTFSFKDRASALVSAFAKENGLTTLVAASTGNAGSSLAGMCASNGQNAIIMVPEKAPLAKLTQIIMYGAKLVPVKGTYDDAFDLSIKATESYGWYNRNTAFNPLTIEGKKTVSFEIYGQLQGQLPDFIFVPTGDGVIISGVYKGFEDLLQLGIISKIPTIVMVQSEGSDNLVQNITNEHFKIKSSNTIADSISVDIPRNFNMAKQFLLKYNGKTLCVSDDEILNASKILSKKTGIFSEPAAATAFAGCIKFHENGWIGSEHKALILLTGSGLKDLKSVQGIIAMQSSVEPDLDELKKYLI